ncbi:hypothetical protein V3C99_011376 [Haemonchus contortus]|uniref:Chloride channel CLIC-like protein 1 n=1 Tax=Haemonchus contortus TaxID=6289 RepID=A0A7I5E7X0_HAECO
MTTHGIWTALVVLEVAVHESLCSINEAAIPADWADPNDPTFSQRNNPFTGQITDASRDVKVHSAYDPTLRLILRQMFKELGVDPLEKTFFTRKAKVSLSSLNMKVIGSYLEMDTLENELSIKEQVRGALHNMFEVYDDEKAPSIWQELLTMSQPWLSLLNMIILPPALFLILKSIMSSRSFWTCIISVFFVVSMVTTYNRIYQEKLAQRMAEAMNRKADACAPNSILEQSLEYLSSFIFFRKKSPCLAFIESQTVSLVAEISLLDVFSDVISNSVFGVLGNLGRHTNRFFREFYENVPLPAMLLMTVTLIFATVRIKTPLFTFEPLLLSTIRYTAGTVARCVEGSRSANERLEQNHRCRAIRENDASVQGSSKDFGDHVTLRRRTPRICSNMNSSPRSRDSSLDSSHSRASSRSQSTPR